MGQAVVPGNSFARMLGVADELRTVLAFFDCAALLGTAIMACPCRELGRARHCPAADHWMTKARLHESQIG
jgi:hypothetical protein